MNNELYETVIELYLKNHSVKDTAEQLNLSIVKVRRILITEGLWVSKRSNEVRALLEKGLTTEEIANQLGLTVKNVQQYIPYSRGLYAEKNTSDSIRSSIYRGRKKEAAQNIKGTYEMGEIIDLSKYLTKKAMLIEQNRQLIMGKAIPKAPLAEKIYTLKLELAERDVFDPQRFKELELAGSSRKDFHKLTKSKDGISRTVQVSSKMPLNALNYLIQRAFGLQNSHLHSFFVDGNELEQLTNNSFPQWQQ
ncbi:MAG: hypothetical protein Q4E99_04945, partial [Bacillota bacterium]|nr:hypothetical protein [Bacillota bacterium]